MFAETLSDVDCEGHDRFHIQNKCGIYSAKSYQTRQQIKVKNGSLVFTISLHPLAEFTKN